MEEHHRKIDLQSSSDLSYLLENIKQVAREKIDLAIPPSAAPDGEDAYRTRVEELVQTYIMSTLSHALPSLTVNGLDPSPAILQSRTQSADGKSAFLSSSRSLDLQSGNYEIYDPRLAERLRALYAHFEDESTKVAELRREAPGAAARAYHEALQAELAKEANAKPCKERGQAGEQKDSHGLTIGYLARSETISVSWAKGLGGMSELGEIPGVMAKLERAERAIDAAEAS